MNELLSNGVISSDAQPLTATQHANNVSDFQLYRNLTASKDIKDFMERISTILKKLGFQDYAFARIDKPAEVEAPLLTAPQKMLSLYKEEALYEHDIYVQYIMNNSEPIFLSTLESHVNSTPFVTDGTRANQQISKLLKSFGFYDYYFIPCPAHNGAGRVVFSITSKDMDRFIFQKQIQKAKLILHQLAEAVDYVGTLKFPDFFLSKGENRNIVITPKPLELLGVLAREDMTLNEAAEYLGRSIYTVNQQIAVARRSLGADTNHGAVYQAIREGLIECKK